MARLYRGIVQSLKEPSDKEVIWIKGKSFFHYNNGEWTQLHIPKAEEISYYLQNEDMDVETVQQAIDALVQMALEGKELDEEITHQNEVISYKLGTISNKVNKIVDVTTFYKGLFISVEQLTSAYPNPAEGSYAHVGETSPYSVWLYTKADGWHNSGEHYDYLPYKIEIVTEEMLEFLAENDLLQDGVIYLGTEEK